jgi:hypothetical protein
MAKNAALNKAAITKADEFYTQLPDVEAEMRHYKDHFRGKVILCNCDDPYESNFFKYFAMNFNFLGLKKLIATSYSDSPVVGQQLSLFQIKGLDLKNSNARQPHKIEITEVIDSNADGAFDLSDVEYLLKNRKNSLMLLNGDGDFRSDECIELLKEADIVVTNPPFSLFREYVAQLIEYRKSFIIIGNQNAVSYMEIFRLLRDNLLWLGQNSGDMEFIVPDYYEPRVTRYREENGIKYRSMGNICWFTNQDVAKRHESITLYKQFTPEAYPRYVNYDAIEVSKVAEIPCDYDGEMGVPITFLDKYNPEQFEIIGSSRFVGKPISRYAKKGTYMGGGMRFYLSNGDGTYKRLYDRIVIKRKGNQ